MKISVWSSCTCWRHDNNNTQLSLTSCLHEGAVADVNMNMLCIEKGSILLLQMDATEKLMRFMVLC